MGTEVPVSYLYLWETNSLDLLPTVPTITTLDSVASMPMFLYAFNNNSGMTAQSRNVPLLTRFKCPLSRLGAVMVEVVQMSLKEADRYAVIQQ